MFNIFAHAGHTHYGMESMNGMSDIDQCMPIIIGAGIIIIILFAILAYLLTAWQPKKQTDSKKKKAQK